MVKLTQIIKLAQKQIAITAIAVSTGGLLITAGPNIAAAQAACPPGYDGSRGYCVPNRNYGDFGYRGRHYRDYGNRGYGRRFGAACPPGYDGSRGYCVPNRDYGDSRRYYRNYGYRPGRRAACPPGYDGRSGRCVPNY